MEVGATPRSSGGSDRDWRRNAAASEEISHQTNNVRIKSLPVPSRLHSILIFDAEFSTKSTCGRRRTPRTNLVRFTTSVQRSACRTLLRQEVIPLAVTSISFSAHEAFPSHRSPVFSLGFFCGWRLTVTPPRPMTSSAYRMLTVAEATEVVLKHTPLLSPILSGLSDCLGHVLAQDVLAPEPLPPFPASMKVRHPHLRVSWPVPSAPSSTVAFAAFLDARCTPSTESRWGIPVHSRAGVFVACHVREYLGKSLLPSHHPTPCPVLSAKWHGQGKNNTAQQNFCHYRMVLRLFPAMAQAITP